MLSPHGIIGDDVSLLIGCGRAASKHLGQKMHSQKTRRRTPGDNQGKRNFKKEKSDKGGGSQAVHEGVAQGLGPEAQGGAGHDGQHRRFETVKQRGNPGHGAVSGIDIAQPHQDKDGRQEETNPRGQATRHPVQQPADIDGQLDGLRPGKQHAIIQGMEKVSGADPAAAVHQLGLHNGDLAGGPAEADEAEFDPKAQGLAKRGRILGPDTFSKIRRFPGEGLVRSR